MLSRPIRSLSGPLAIGVGGLLLAGCQSESALDHFPTQHRDNAAHARAVVYHPRNGKLLASGADKQRDVFRAVDADTLYAPIRWTPEVLEGLARQRTLLQKRKLDRDRFGNLAIDEAKLLFTLDRLLDNAEADLPPLAGLDAYRLRGADQRGNVRFTGYYSPVVKVRRRADQKYRFPIYRKPDWEGPLPTRREIDGPRRLLQNEPDLVIAYAADPVAIYYLQLQGSGILEYAEDGRRQTLGYGGSNRHPYRSLDRFIIKQGKDFPLKSVAPAAIRRYLRRHPEMVDSLLFQNPSYVFFRERKRAAIRGAGHVPLLGGMTIAVDPRYIPLGSVLLGAVPTLDERGKVSGHDYRLLVAQDTGGAIRGPGHVDLYHGIGEAAQRAAGRLHHYGRLWLLLDSDNALASN